MIDTTILMPIYKCLGLISVTIPHLLFTLTERDKLIVIVNEPDRATLEFLDSQQVEYVISDTNLGPVAVDLAMDRIEGELVTNINSDMVFSEGWTRQVAARFTDDYVGSVSCLLVEPTAKSRNNGSTYVQYGDYGSTLTDSICKKFNEDAKSGKYTQRDLTSFYNHPITCRVGDFKKVGGYSNNFEPIWIETIGRAADPYFAYRLWELYDRQFTFKLCGTAPVYHVSSLASITANNTSNHLRAKSHQAFYDRTGIPVTSFREQLG